jgi:Ca2+/H+ antiporter, TMEM165/GDT1 family
VDALMAALIVAALAQLGDRTPRLAATLADRYSPGAAIAGAGVGLAAVYAAGAALGAAIAPKLTPNVALLLLALALLLAAVTMAVAPKEPDRLSGWRIGGFLTALLGIAILAFGDSTQFVAAALAARGSAPWLAAAGATIGALATVSTAALLGETAWQRLPLRPARLAGAALLGIAGIVLGLSGARLI